MYLHRKIFPSICRGAIYILPQRIDEQGILKHYKTLYETNGDPQMRKLYRSFMKDIKAQLMNCYQSVAIGYAICFTDSRDREEKVVEWLAE